MSAPVPPAGGPVAAGGVEPRLSAALTGRYRIERELGRGGMATVYLALDLRHGRDVALKVMHPELALARERFLREIGVAAALSHPHIVPLHDSGDADGLLYYVMPYVAGRSLRSRLDAGALPLDDVTRIARQVADAIGSAHQRGIVHRDIKPENILLRDDGHALISDFGVAKAAHAARDERLTRTGVSVGTPAYMSPEQLYAEDVDARADVWALGCVMFEMLTGRVIGRGLTRDTKAAAQVAEELRRLRPDVPAHLVEVVQRSLAPDAADRLPNGQALALAIGPDTTRPLAAQRPDRMRVALIAGLVVATSVAAWYVLRPRATAPAADPAVMALHALGVREYERRTPDGSIEAVRAFKAAVDRDSTFARAWVGLANTYARSLIRGWNYPGVVSDSVLRLAVAASHRALALDSTDAWAWVARAEVSRLVDPTANGPAFRAAQRAVAIDSSNGHAWFVLGMNHADSGDVDAAVASWRESVRRNPGYNQGLAFLALGHFWRGRNDSAAFWIDSAIAVDPSYHLARHTQGLIEIERRRYARALSAMEAARRITTESEVPIAIAGRATAEALSGEFQRARATLRLADSLARTFTPTPLHTAIYMSIGYAAAGDRLTAIEWLRRYPIRDDRHFLLHLQCEPAFRLLARDSAFRAFLTTPGRGPAC